MLAAIASPDFDPAGHVLIELLPTQGGRELTRRVSVVATLDGGSAVNNFGFSDSDTTIELRWLPVDPFADTLAQRMLQTLEVVHVSYAGSFYAAAPESYRPSAEESTLRLLVLAKLSD